MCMDYRTLWDNTYRCMELTTCVGHCVIFTKFRLHTVRAIFSQNTSVKMWRKNKTTAKLHSGDELQLNVIRFVSICRGQSYNS